MSQINADQAQAIYLAIGSITANWAYVEMGVDQLIEIGYAAFDGSRIRPIRPGSLKERLAFIRKLALHPRLLRYKQALILFADDASTLAQARHSTIHGAILGFEPDNSAILQVWKYRGGKSELQSTKVTEADLIQLYDRVLALAERSARLANDVINYEENQAGS